jgi:hypothetical protein
MPHPNCRNREGLQISRFSDICRIKTYRKNNKTPQKKLAPISSLIHSHMDWTDVWYWVTVGKSFAALQ